MCRFGGDEFVIMLPELDRRGTLETVVAKVRETLAAPYRVAGWMIRMTTSTGQDIYPRDANCGAALISKADQDLCRCKTAYRRTVITTAPANLSKQR